MKVIDAHTHIMPPEMIADRLALLRRDRWFGMLYENPGARLATGPQLIESMRASGVAASVSFGFAFADLDLCRLCNDYVIEMAGRYPDKIIPFALTNPAVGVPALEEAQRCLEQGARGIGELMPDGQGFSFDGDDLVPLLEMARGYAVPVLLHVNEQVGHDYAGKGLYGPTAAYRLARRFPDNEFIFAHWGGGLPFFELMPELKKSLGNVYYDTAASLFLYRDSIFGHLLAEIPHRILFGTDYPLIGQGRFLARIHNTTLTSEQLGRLLSYNAGRLLGIPGLCD